MTAILSKSQLLFTGMFVLGIGAGIAITQIQPNSAQARTPYGEISAKSWETRVYLSSEWFDNHKFTPAKPDAPVKLAAVTQDAAPAAKTEPVKPVNVSKPKPVEEDTDDDEADATPAQKYKTIRYYKRIVTRRGRVKYVKRFKRVLEKAEAETVPVDTYDRTDRIARRAMGDLVPTKVTLASGRKPETKEEVAALIKATAQKEGVDEHFALSLAYLENGFKPRGISSAGARCPMQVMPGTARLYKPDITIHELDDPRTCVPIGMRYLKQALESANGDKDAAAARYEAGIGSGRTDSSYARKVRMLHKHPAVLAALGNKHSGWSFNRTADASPARPEGN